MKTLDELYHCVLLSEEEVKNTLEEIGWQKIIDAVAETFTEEARQRTVSPPKLIIPIHEYNNDYRMMPSRILKYPEFCGTKVVGACTDNPKKYNLPLAMGIYILNYTPDMRPLMICGCSELTAYRTAAATAVAVRELAKKEPKTLGIIGCGQQAYYHIPAILTIRPSIKKIYVYDIFPLNITKITEHFTDLNILGTTKKKLLEKSDVVVTMTPTTKPHIFKRDIPNKEMLICSIGGDAKHKLELHPEILTIADHFCDSYDQVAHTGMIIKAFEEKIITKDDLRSLGSYMIDKFKHTENYNLRLFLSTGVALEDIATAILIYKKYMDIIESFVLN